MANASALYNPAPTVAPDPLTRNDYLTPRASPEAFGSQIGEAVRRSGAQLERSGQQVADLVLAQQKLTNELYANDANTRMAAQHTDNWSNYSRLEGRAAFEALPQFKKDSEKIYQEGLAAAPNSEAKVMLGRSARYLTDAYLRYGSNHADQQWRKWQDDSANREADMYANQAALSINDPRQMELFVNSGASAIRKIPEQRGMGPDEAGAVESQYRGKTWGKIVGIMAEQGDVRGANALYHAHEKEMDAGSQLAISTKLRSMLLQTHADDLVQTLVGQTQAPQAGGRMLPAAVTDAQIAVESGGNPQAVSPKGARGIMQLMPGTAREMAEDMGLPYDEKALTENPAYNRQLGVRYMEGLTKKYGGNQTLALAAYNAGPARVDEWLKTYGDPRSGKLSEGDWLAQVPYAETRNYVTRVTQMAQNATPAGGGLPDRGDMLKRAMYLTDGHPDLQRAVLGQLEQRYRVEQASIIDQQRAEAMQAKAQKSAQEDTGKQFLARLTPESGLPALSAMDILKSNLPWEQQQHFLTMLKSGAGGEHDPKTYGSGFYQAFQDVHAPPGAPGRITDPSQLYSRVGPHPVEPPNFPLNNAPGMVEPGNVEPWDRPSLKNPDGSYSTTSSISIGTDKGETVIPTVIGGRRLTEEQAIEHYRRTGENLGTFSTQDAAVDYARKLHEAQASIGDGQGGRRMAQGDLTVAGVDKLTSEIMGRRTPDGEANAKLWDQFMKVQHAALSGHSDLMKIRDPKGEEIFLRFMPLAYAAKDAGQKAGKTVGEMVDPQSKDYIGKLALPLKRPMSQWLKDLDDAASEMAPGQAAMDLTTEAGIIGAWNRKLITREEAEAEAIKRGFLKPAVSAPTR